MTDIAEVLVAHFPGIVVQKNLFDVIAQWLAEHGAVTDDDVPAILAAANALAAAPRGEDFAAIVGGPGGFALDPPVDPYPLALPPYPAGMVRFPDSNSTPDGWSIDRGADLAATVTDATEVRGGSPAHEHHEPG